MSIATSARGGRAGELTGAVERLGSCRSAGGEGGGGGGGLAALADRSDPLSALLGSPASFLIDHIGFVRAGFDYLTGDPDAIQAHADGLRAASRQLNAIAQDRDGELATVTSLWQGADATAYTRRGQLQVSTIQAAATAADHLADQMLQAGGVIGDARQQAKDGLDTLLSWLIGEAVAAAATAIETAGASVAVFIGTAVAEALVFANRVVKIVEDVEKVIADILGVVRAVGQLVDDVNGLLGLAGGDAGSTSTAGSQGSGDDGNGRDGGDGRGGGDGGDGGDGGEKKERPSITIGRDGKWGVDVPGVGHYHRDPEKGNGWGVERPGVGSYRWDPDQGHSIGLGDDGPRISYDPRPPSGHEGGSDGGHPGGSGYDGGSSPSSPRHPSYPSHPPRHYPPPQHQVPQMHHGRR